MVINLIRRIILTVLLVFTGGCTAMIPAESLTIWVESGWVADADGYVARSQPDRGAELKTVKINLDRAPPFIIKLPDGHRVTSKNVDRSLLLEHTFKISKIGKEEHAFGTNEPGFHLFGNILHFDFGLRPDGKADWLGLDLCGKSSSDVLESVGGHHFDLPMTRAEFELLIGAPAEVKRFYAVLGWSC